MKPDRGQKHKGRSPMPKIAAAVPIQRYFFTAGGPEADDNVIKIDYGLLLRPRRREFVPGGPWDQRFKSREDSPQA